MPEDMLPTTRHIKELVDHSEEHMESGTERDLKVSLIHADNSIEIMLKEYLRYTKEKSWSKIEHMTFYDLLNACNDIDLVNTSKKFFLAFHDMRNAVYHTGTLVPMKKDVQSIIGFAKTLFNELHPKLKFSKASLKLPSKKSLHTVYGSTGFQPHMTYMLLLGEFSNFFMRKGYRIAVEPAMPDRSRADLIAQTDHELIICEFKITRYDVLSGLAQRAIYFLRTQVDVLKKEKPDRNIEAWLITNARFPKHMIDLAKKYNIRLFDGQQLKKILGNKIQTYLG